MKEEEKHKELIIPVLTGSFFDLRKFDFLFKNIKIYDVVENDFKIYIDGIKTATSDNFSFFGDIVRKHTGEYDKAYALTKIDPLNNFDFSEMMNVWKMLLIIFPSDLNMEYCIHYHLYEGEINSAWMTTYEKRQTGDYPGKPLYTNDDSIPEINQFIKKYFERLSTDGYVGMCIENYMMSYNASSEIYQYLHLCIALENTLDGSNELSYRLKRTIAVLCGSTPFNCDILFKNLAKMYGLRSKIMHGEKYDFKKVLKYLNTLKSIVSRTIIELLIHDIPTNVELNDIITKLGFGDRNKISEQWQEYKLNLVTDVDINWRDIDTWS